MLDRAKHIQNFLKPELVEFLTNYIYLCKKVSETSNTNKYLEGDGQVSGAKFVTYGDIAIDSLLETYFPKIQEVWDKKLYPSFTYARIYGAGTGLDMHRDRIGSDVTCSVKLSGPPFPFVINGEEGSAERPQHYIISQGDALVWNGNKYTHGHSDEISDEGLHLLLICTEYEDHMYDKRKHLGLLPETREGKEGYDYKDPTYGHDETNNFLTTRNTNDTTT
jgi:hypothetical protein